LDTIGIVTLTVSVAAAIRLDVICALLFGKRP
jgi:hypothetical protein